MMLRNLFDLESLKSMLYMIPAILISISAHEFAHGYVSYKFGDPTAKREGRLTLNPLAHMDLWGTICMLVFRMGWAKPVPINPYYYKNRRKGIIAVSLAGPCMNYLLAFLSMLLYGICYVLGVNMNISIWFYYLALINVGLGTFNLIPFPPLDGSNVLAELVPKVNEFYFKLRRYSMLILMICLATGLLEKPLSMLNGAVLNGMWSIISKILNFIFFHGTLI